MHSTDMAITKDPLAWPEQPSGILIMGKRQGTKKENKQLWGRTAMAAALWYSAPQPKPYIIFGASDIHGPKNTPDAYVVKSMLLKEYQIPADYLIVRQKTNCTLLEVRLTKAISKVYDLANIFVLTHLYHAPRTQRYINEVLTNASVIPVHPDILKEIVFPLDLADLYTQLSQTVVDSQPSRLDLMREYIVETVLTFSHTLDPKGRIERRISKIIRPRAY